MIPALGLTAKYKINLMGFLMCVGLLVPLCIKPKFNEKRDPIYILYIRANPTELVLAKDIYNNYTSF